ncbi:hypothetical protein WG66_003867 [Moniliophthora roreri]|uniref:DUF6699 domain-containing protein n=1 Tax=Moniliophthora roreri TaxID=221103 RepID=A0A0W0F6X2_MONRR|nr:hypothetical protein WG66_003867 [Moniliophthora roreri]
MTSYLRAIFGVGSSRTDRSKTHTRSHSIPAPQQAGRPVYVYTTTPTTTVTPAQVQAHPPSYPARPSPLRYDTYDDPTVESNRSRSRSGSSGSHPRTPSGHVIYKSGDKHFPYPVYTPTATTSSSRGSSSRSNSNTSIYPPPSSASSHSQQSHYTPAPPRTSSSGSVASRPALKQTHTSHAGQKPGGPRPHVSFVNPKRPQTLHMHPLLAASHRSRAPISYDVMFAPSSRTIVDRSTRTSVPSHTLHQPATDPPTAGRLVLRSDKFPWSIIVQAGISSSASQIQTPKSAAKFYLGGATSAPKGGGGGGGGGGGSLPVSNLDLIHAIHSTLFTRVTKEEWDALGAGSRAQRKVTKAYETRCRAIGGGWDQGVKRIDWLGGKTRLIGVEVDKTASDTGVAKLVFEKP